MFMLHLQTTSPSSRLFVSACLSALLISFGVCGTYSDASRPQAERPNILVIMADDMGYSDLGAYGGEIDTPALDALAESGLQFTNFYTNNMCVPTRAAMLTGTYPSQAFSRETRTLSDQVVTMAELLGDAGYGTWLSGKWHIGPWRKERKNRQESWPLQRGFDQFYGTIIGASSFFAPNSLKRGNTSAEDDYLRDDFYYTDAIGSNALRFIEDMEAEERPFFGFVAFTAPHWPLHALEADIDKYRGAYDEGWDVLRQRRHARMINQGVIEPNTPLSPRDPEVPAWEEVPEEKKAWEVRRMEVYAAQIDRMDRNVGRIVEALEDTGELSNTLIFFLSDNGGCHVGFSTTRGGPYVPDTTRDGRSLTSGNLPSIMPGPEDTYQSYGRGWANLSNTPYRLYKKFDHEGGIRTPLIVHWPRGLERSGQITRQTGHIMDIMATAVEVTGTSYPTTFNGTSIHPLEGKSLLPIFNGGHRAGHDMLFWEWANGRAVRQGNWKLVSANREPWELYDLEADGAELNDRSAKEPAKTQELLTAWKAWAERVGARD